MRVSGISKTRLRVSGISKTRQGGINKPHICIKLSSTNEKWKVIFIYREKNPIKRKLIKEFVDKLNDKLYEKNSNS